ncbi:hypothetical protein F5B17DRAFT_61880 [Nemania serpens]|nr:hypothetical protein F5B17DRAFT_61880 [Nemania serpens]
MSTAKLPALPLFLIFTTWRRGSEALTRSGLLRFSRPLVYLYLASGVVESAIRQVASTQSVVFSHSLIPIVAQFTTGKRRRTGWYGMESTTAWTRRSKITDATDDFRVKQGAQFLCLSNSVGTSEGRDFGGKHSTMYGSYGCQVEDRVAEGWVSEAPFMAIIALCTTGGDAGVD